MEQEDKVGHDHGSCDLYFGDDCDFGYGSALFPLGRYSSLLERVPVGRTHNDGSGSSLVGIVCRSMISAFQYNLT